MLSAKAGGLWNVQCTHLIQCPKCKFSFNRKEYILFQKPMIAKHPVSVEAFGVRLRELKKKKMRIKVTQMWKTILNGLMY